MGSPLNQSVVEGRATGTHQPIRDGGHHNMSMKMVTDATNCPQNQPPALLTWVDPYLKMLLYIYKYPVLLLNDKSI